MPTLQLRRNIYLPGLSKTKQAISIACQPPVPEQNTKPFNPGLHLAWSWMCVFYSIFLICLGLGFPMSFGVILISNDNVLDSYLVWIFYLYLYSLSVLCMVIKYIVSDHARQTLMAFLDSVGKFVIKMFKLAKEGAKVTCVVVVVTILLDISDFIHLKFLEDLCQPNLKEAVSVVQLLYIIGLSHYCMNNHKVKLHRYLMFAHFCLAHLLATTMCTGLLFISYDTVAKLEQWILNDGEESSDKEIGAETLQAMNSSFKLRLLMQNQESENTDLPFCHLKTYIKDLSRHIGPYTFTFSMFYIYICSIILLHLILHYRGFVQRNIHSSSSHLWTLFRRKHKGGLQNSISGVASISLIIGAFVVSILSLDGEDNVFIHIYLLILHSQANIVGLLVLKRFSRMPIDPKRSVAADYLALLFFFFGVVLYNVAKHVTAVFGEERVSILEIATSAVEVLQTLEQTVLILVGLKIVTNSDYANSSQNEPPTELLLHLTAGNISTLITSIFLTRMELFNMSEYLENSEHLFSLGLAWSVMGSVLLPWQAFYRYYSIICLAEVKKIVESEVKK